MNSLDNFDSKVLDKLFSDKMDDVSENCPMPKGEFPSETPLAMAYVPFQCWEEPYDRDTAFARGTIFPSLDKPFIGEEAVKNAHSH